MNDACILLERGPVYLKIIYVADGRFISIRHVHNEKSLPENWRII
jgi:hypothetical protein